MTENFFQLAGCKKESHLREKLTKRSKVEGKVKGVIKKRVAIKAQNNSERAFVLEEVEGLVATESTKSSWTREAKTFLRIGYWIMDRNKGWKWGGNAPFISKRDLRDLLRKAHRHGIF